MKLTVHLDDAAKVIAQLVREGVTFEANQQGDSVVIKFLGGF